VTHVSVVTCGEEHTHIPSETRPSLVRKLRGTFAEQGRGLVNTISDHRPVVSDVISYHAFCVSPDDLPSCLRATAHSEDGAIMAVEHADLPVAGVQFQPDSILTLYDELGLKLIDNVVRRLAVASGAASLYHE